MEKQKVHITLVKGVEGNSLYINDTRVYGNKPWGGALKTIFEATIPVDDIIKALENKL